MGGAAGGAFYPMRFRKSGGRRATARKSRGPMRLTRRCSEGPVGRTSRRWSAGGRCVLPTTVQEVSDITFAIDRTDKKAGGRWASPTGGPMRRKCRFGKRGRRCVLLAVVQGVAEIAYATNRTDKIQVVDGPPLLGGRYVERADLDNAVADACCLQRFRKSVGKHIAAAKPRRSVRFTHRGPDSLRYHACDRSH